MAFNGKMKRQEALSKEDVQLLKQAIEIACRNESFASFERLEFLAQKLERMERGFK